MPDMRDFRCRCGRLLGRIIDQKGLPSALVEVKCPRCGRLERSPEVVRWPMESDKPEPGDLLAVR